MTASALIPVRLLHKTRLADDIVGLTLGRLDGRELPAFDAGAHIDLHLPNGLIRQYSLCNNPQQHQTYELGILRDPTSRGGSLAVHDQLQEGDELLISAPRNLFPLLAGEHTLLLAGGIGITPMLAMAHSLAASAASFELHYSARSRSRAAFLEQLASADWHLAVQCHFDDDPTTPALDLTALLHSHAGKQLYVCGPAGFIQWVRSSAATAGWPEAQVHFEAFSAPVPESAGSTDGAFELLVTSSGQIIPVAAGQSAAQAMSAAGLSVALSCEQGICGSCLTPILDGEPDHRDFFQTDAEKTANRQFTPCCSRSRSRRLVLDL